MFFFAAIDAPGGFLFEWWSVFWDIFIARTNEKHSDVAASYIEVSVYAFSCLFMSNFYLMYWCLTCLLLFLSPSTNSKFFCAWVLVHLESEHMPVWTRGFFFQIRELAVISLWFSCVPDMLLVVQGYCLQTNPELFSIWHDWLYTHAQMFISFY